MQEVNEHPPPSCASVPPSRARYVCLPEASGEGHRNGVCIAVVVCARTSSRQPVWTTATLSYSR